MFTIEMSEEEYRIIGPNGEEGATVDYGEVATLTINDAIFYARIADPNKETPRVMRVDSVSAMKTETEDVEFSDQEDVSEGPILVGKEDDEDDDEEEDEDDGGVEIEDGEVTA